MLEVSTLYLNLCMKQVTVIEIFDEVLKQFEISLTLGISPQRYKPKVWRDFQMYQ